MAKLEIPQVLRDIYGSFHEKVMAAAKGIDKPMEWPLEAVAGPGIAETIAQGVAPEKIEDAFIGGILNLMPGYIAANYRTPEMIAELRRAMAAENRARGAVGQQNRADLIWHRNTNEALAPTSTTNGPMYDIPEVLPYKETDPLDQILRGSWFHGMRPEARQTVLEASPGWEAFRRDLIYGDAIGSTYNTPENILSLANQYNLPASTHATPSYTRFGEPYGVSLSASPSIARNFSADEYIHRVQPLYGGPPTERIIPLWRPEGQKAINEGYNAAFNQFISEGPPGVNRINSLANRLNEVGGKYGLEPLEPTVEGWATRLGMGQPEASRFNTLYSKALQDQGYRGILYSPQRYGEYEMLMLDPSFVRPLDYRPLADYTQSMNAPKFPITGPPGTPGARRGYAAAEPEFATGATRLSDVFNQMPWVDRINEENKRRIAELVDAQYREAVINQLFGGR